MSERVVLVTGVGHRLGARVAARLAAAPGVTRVLGVDTVGPESSFAAAGDERVPEFIRTDIRGPLIAEVIRSAGVDTVVHLSGVSSAHRTGSVAAARDMHLTGTIRLLATAGRIPGVRQWVLGSTTSVYGSSPRDPAVFTEDMEGGSLPRGGTGRAALELEGYVRALARRRPEVGVRVVRLADIVDPSPGAEPSPLLNYLTLPVVPVVAGFDPRLQFLHVDDAVRALARIALDGAAATVNVAGDGVLFLSQVIRRAGRVPIPVPRIAAGTSGGVLRRLGVTGLTPDQINYLRYGRCVDTGRLRASEGCVPHYSSARAFEQYVSAHDLTSPLSPATLDGVQRTVHSVLTRARGVLGHG